MKNQSSDEFASRLLARKSSTKLLIAIGFDSQDLECLDLYNINEGWKVLTRQVYSKKYYISKCLFYFHIKWEN